MLWARMLADLTVVVHATYVSFVVLGLATLMCELDRLLAARTAGLERRVIERTSQLTSANEKLAESEAEAKTRAEELAVILDAVPGMALISRDPACDTISGSLNAKYSSPSRPKPP